MSENKSQASADRNQDAVDERSGCRPCRETHRDSTRREALRYFDGTVTVKTYEEARSLPREDQN